MPRNKKGARGTSKSRGGFQNTTHSTAQHGARSIQCADYTDTFLAQANLKFLDSSKPHLSLAEEARNTERHHGWNSDLKLRHTHVNFVNSGNSKNAADSDHGFEALVCKDPDEVVEDALGNPERSLAQMSLHGTSEDLVARINCPNRRQTTKTSEHGHQTDNNELLDDSEVEFMNPFVVDLNPQFVETGLPPPQLRRSTSATSSVSSEEVIMFRGRDRDRQSNKNKLCPGTETMECLATTHIQSGRNDSGIVDISKPRLYHKHTTWKTLEKETLSSLPAPSDGIAEPSRSVLEGTLSTPLKLKRLRPGSRRIKRGRDLRMDNQDAVLVDYITNLLENGGDDTLSMAGVISSGDLANPDKDMWQDETEQSTCEEDHNPLARRGSSDDYAHELQELRITSGVFKSVEMILSKRERPTGIQYLVVWEGSTIEDAKWISSSSLNIPGGSNTKAHPAGRAHSAPKSETIADDVDDGSEREEQTAQDIVADRLALLDKEEKFDIMKTRMNDEQIAMRLAKQEELGLGSAQIMLFDGDDIEDWSDEQHIERLKKDAFTYTELSKTKKGKSRSSFVQADMFADILMTEPYNGFDIMDYERPSLKRVFKGGRGRQTAELSDSELEVSRQMAWENDRTKKKAQKQHREELRVQGLLGRGGKLDMRTKYAEGMSISQMKEEIKEFLLSDKAR